MSISNDKHKYVELMLELVTLKMRLGREGKSKEILSKEENGLINVITKNKDVELVDFGRLRYGKVTPYTYRKIADEMGVSVAKVYYLRRRLLDDLYEELKRQGKGYFGD